MPLFTKDSVLNKRPEAEKIATIFSKWYEEAREMQALVEDLMDKDQSLEKNNFLNEVYRVCDDVVDSTEELKASQTIPI